MEKDYKEIGNALLQKAEEFKREKLEFIVNAMAKHKEMFTFRNFDEEDGYIYEDVFDEDSITDNPIATSVGWDFDAEDFYIVGIKYIEQENAREPYYIELYGAMLKDPTYIKKYAFTDILSESYENIIAYITNNI